MLANQSDVIAAVTKAQGATALQKLALAINSALVDSVSQSLKTTESRPKMIIKNGPHGKEITTINLFVINWANLLNEHCNELVLGTVDLSGFEVARTENAEPTPTKSTRIDQGAYELKEQFFGLALKLNNDYITNDPEPIGRKNASRINRLECLKDLIEEHPDCFQEQTRNELITEIKQELSNMNIIRRNAIKTTRTANRLRDWLRWTSQKPAAALERTMPISELATRVKQALDAKVTELTGGQITAVNHMNPNWKTEFAKAMEPAKAAPGQPAAKAEPAYAAQPARPLTQPSAAITAPKPAETIDPVQQILTELDSIAGRNKRITKAVGIALDIANPIRIISRKAAAKADELSKKVDALANFRIGKLRIPRAIPAALISGGIGFGIGYGIRKIFEFADPLYFLSAGLGTFMATQAALDGIANWAVNRRITKTANNPDYHVGRIAERLVHLKRSGIEITEEQIQEELSNVKTRLGEVTGQEQLASTQLAKMIKKYSRKAKIWSALRTTAAMVAGIAAGAMAFFKVNPLELLNDGFKSIGKSYSNWTHARAGIYNVDNAPQEIPNPHNAFANGQHGNGLQAKTDAQVVKPEPAVTAPKPEAVAPAVAAPKPEAPTPVEQPKIEPVKSDPTIAQPRAIPQPLVEKHDRLLHELHELRKKGIVDPQEYATAHAVIEKANDLSRYDHKESYDTYSAARTLLNAAKHDQFADHLEKGEKFWDAAKSAGMTRPEAESIANSFATGDGCKFRELLRDGTIASHMDTKEQIFERLGAGRARTQALKGLAANYGKLKNAVKGCP